MEWRYNFRSYNVFLKNLGVELIDFAKSKRFADRIISLNFWPVDVSCVFMISIKLLLLRCIQRFFFFFFPSSRHRQCSVSIFLLPFPTQLKCASANPSDNYTNRTVELLNQMIHMASRRPSGTQQISSDTTPMTTSHTQTQKHSTEKNT